MNVYTVRETADLLKVSAKTVLRKVADQQLGCCRDGRIIRFTDEHIAAYLCQCDCAVRQDHEVAAFVARGRFREHPELFAGRRTRSSRGRAPGTRG